MRANLVKLAISVVAAIVIIALISALAWGFFSMLRPGGAASAARSGASSGSISGGGGGAVIAVPTATPNPVGVPQDSASEETQYSPSPTVSMLQSQPQQFTAGYGGMDQVPGGNVLIQTPSTAQFPGGTEGGPIPRVLPSGENVSGGPIYGTGSGKNAVIPTSVRNVSPRVRNVSPGVRPSGIVESAPSANYPIGTSAMPNVPVEGLDAYQGGWCQVIMALLRVLPLIFPGYDPGVQWYTV
ncbi:MAG TPA: hypothetical protein VK436_07800 [Methanocella sp.]|nr:hypothetical protein [Methanocella sp.]